MTKEELIAKIKEADLEQKLESLLLDIVNQAAEINDDLLTIIVELLDVSAEIDLAEIEALDSENNIYSDVLLALDYLKAQYEQYITSGEASAYKQALNNIQAKIQELSQSTQQTAETPNVDPSMQQPESQPAPQDNQAQTQNQNPW